MRYGYTEFDMPELQNRAFTENQLKELYRDLTGQGTVDRAEYPDFDCWLYDMLRAGLFTVIK